MSFPIQPDLRSPKRNAEDIPGSNVRQRVELEVRAQLLHTLLHNFCCMTP